MSVVSRCLCTCAKDVALVAGERMLVAPRGVSDKAGSYARWNILFEIPFQQRSVCCVD